MVAKRRMTIRLRSDGVLSMGGMMAETQTFIDCHKKYIEKNLRGSMTAFFLLLSPELLVDEISFDIFG